MDQEKNYELEATKVISNFKDIFLVTFTIIVSIGILVAIVSKISSEIGKGSGLISSAQASPLNDSLKLGDDSKTDTTAIDSARIDKAIGEVVKEAERISAENHDNPEDTIFSDISPEKIAKMAMQEIFRKHPDAAINCVLSDRRLWSRVLEEVEISNAIRCGIDALPEIQDLYGQMIADSCIVKDIDPDLGMAVVAIESQGHRRATSPKKARGLWQIMMASAKTICLTVGMTPPKSAEQLYDPAFNTSLGTWHLALSMSKFDGDPVKAVVAYEIGDGGVKWQLRRYGSLERVPYYRKVFGVYSDIKAKKGEFIASNMTPAPAVTLAGK